MRDWAFWRDPWWDKSVQEVSDAFSSVAACEGPECPESFIAAAEGPGKVAILELYSSELKRTRCGTKKVWWLLFPEDILSAHLVKRVKHALEPEAEAEAAWDTTETAEDDTTTTEASMGTRLTICYFE
jgi:hypothetical protein